MMRIPAPLTVALTKARIARIFKPRQHRNLLDFVDPAEVLHLGSAHPISHDKIRGFLSSSAAALWIGGSEPLDHPGIAHFVRALAQSRHLIFLETNGILLRRRIHEFQPLPQLFLVVRVDAQEKSDSKVAIESLRAARLSGFFTVVHSVVNEAPDFDELSQLRAVLLEMDLDGWLITGASATPEVVGRAAEARSCIPSAAWRWFSTRVEHELLAQEKSRASTELPRAEKRHGETCEEGMKVA